MTPDQLEAIHAKLDELIRELRNNRQAEQRHGLAIGELQQWRDAHEAMHQDERADTLRDGHQ
jgi:hypothetical protein